MSGERAAPATWLPPTSATSDARTLPSRSLKLSERTVKSGVPSFALRYVSVMFAPQHERPPPTVPRLTSSHETALHE